MRKVLLACSVVIVAAALSLYSAFSHSGRTDSSGGHYNRKTGEYHYHGGGPAVPVTPPKPKPVVPEDVPRDNITLLRREIKLVAEEIVLLREEIAVLREELKSHGESHHEIRLSVEPVAHEIRLFVEPVDANHITKKSNNIPSVR